MLGHSSLQMIFTKYYAWMPKETRNDGSATMRAYESVQAGKGGKAKVAVQSDRL